MKVRFLKNTTDRYNGKIYYAGEELEVTQDRAEELVKAGVAISISEKPKTKEEKKWL